MSKIVHICMCGPVTDGWTYQDNLLTKYHRKLGYDVTIITSKWIWDTKGRLIKDRRDTYINENDVKVIRLNIKKDRFFETKFKRYESFGETIASEKPDVLFIHGCQFLDIWLIGEYLKENPSVKAYIDNHADFSNSGTNFFSKYILHKIIWKCGAKKIAPYIRKFYGVLPARVDFLKKMYGIKSENVELLVMGADDEMVRKNESADNIEEVRRRLGLVESDFVIITGGKIDKAKAQTLILIRAFKEIINNNLKLILFGSVDDELWDEFNSLVLSDSRITYLGWLKSEETYPYIAISNLAVYPGRHSVLWEQTAGQGIPMICKYWEGTTHVDVGGNVIFLYNDSVDEIKRNILNVIMKQDVYMYMKNVGRRKAMDYFSYQEIAKKSIELF